MRAPDPGAKLRELAQRPLVKVCGLTRQEDVDAAVEAGADLVGFILAAESPRRADALLDAPETVLRVAVFVGESDETDADLVQLYARENGHRARDAVLLRARRARRHRSSTCRGARRTRRTSSARARPTGRVMLAGGLGAGQRRARRSRRCGRGRSTRRARPSRRPGSRTTTRCALGRGARG